MEKRDIINRFLKEGYQLGASSLDYFSENPEKIEPFIEKTRDRKQQPSIINIDMIKVAFDLTKERKKKIMVLKNLLLKEMKEKISISEYTKRIIQYYEKKKALLLPSLDSKKIISINKIKKQKKFLIICMIREIDYVDQSVLVEDLTGSETLFFEDGDELKSLKENDVVGVLCERRAEGIWAKRTIFPDIPLKRDIKSTEGKVNCIFISDIHMGSESFEQGRYKKLVKKVAAACGNGESYVLILGNISSKKEDVDSLIDAMPESAHKVFLKGDTDALPDSREDISVIETPSMVGIGGVRVLITDGGDLRKYKGVLGEQVEDVMIEILRRRELAPPIKPFMGHILIQNRIIEGIPDIFATGGFRSPKTINYKGTTLLSTGSLAGYPTFWKVDLKTREINKIVVQ